MLHLLQPVVQEALCQINDVLVDGNYQYFVRHNTFVVMDRCDCGPGQ
jgi:hypothetical protein